MEYNKLLPQGCQHPHLLDPGLPARADGLLWLLVVLGGQFSNVECNQPRSMEVVLGRRAPP